MSLAERKARLDQEAIQSIIHGFSLADSSATPNEIAEVILQSLRTVNRDFCPACYYKRKRPTGEPLNDGVLVDIDIIIQQPQRDGDSGDLDVRRGHTNRVLMTLAGEGLNGLTDVELAERTGIYLDSAKGCRAGLMQGGWVMASGRKRLSPRGRPMTVWVLTPPAWNRLQELLPDE